MTPTPQQSAASRQNSQLSTGPRTEQGKINSSQNATTHGLYATNPAHLTPEDQIAWHDLTTAILETLRPANPLEQTLATEIARASWRLNRCATLEDTTEDRATEIAIDRARAQALNTLLKATAELRRLQTNRQIQTEVFPDGIDVPAQPLVVAKDLIAAHAHYNRARCLAEKVSDMDEFTSVIHRAASGAIPDRSTSFRKTPQTPPAAAPQTPQIARNAACPCGSNEKFKRCCGKNAPPVLSHAA